MGNLGAMRRVERLINLIAALLEAEKPMTAEEIRRRIAGYDNPDKEAFRRAFERDKADLKAMGIPVETRALDPFGDTPPGYTIPKARYYLPDLDLEPDEVAALRIAAGAVVGVQDEAGTGVMKLSLGALDETSAGARLAWNADVAASQPLLGPLYGAVAERVPITFGYQPAGADEPSTREVEPFALVHRRGHWYLVGRDRQRDDVRTFKVARVVGESITRLDGTYEVPSDFDASSHLAGGGVPVETEDALVATIRFDPSVRWWPEQNLPAASTAEGPGGSLEVEMPMANQEQLVSFVAWWGPKVEIVAPEDARAALIERMKAFTS